jgi:hypothetical protein
MTLYKEVENACDMHSSGKFGYNTDHSNWEFCVFSTIIHAKDRLAH